MIGDHHEDDGYMFDKYEGKADLNAILIFNVSSEVHRI